MDILKGLIYVNDNDVFLAYGAFLSEDKAADNTNYSALLKPSSMKPYTVVSFREEDGERLPKVLTPSLEARDIVLQFSIVASDKTTFLRQHKAFLLMLRSGWLDIYLPELETTYKVYYTSCSEYKQLTPFNGNKVAGKFKIKFREPKPTI